jgi:hypothetical protein
MLVLLSGCGVNGDFGRLKASIAPDDTHYWMGPAAARSAVDPPWRHQLTDEERKLRDLAYPLVEPPYDRDRWTRALAQHGLAARPWPYPDRAAYASRLFQTPYRSQVARYNKLIEDIRLDVARLDPFFAAARHVSDMDRKRERSLAYVTNLSPEERHNTLQRIEENKAIVKWTQASLHERVASYQLALERLVIAAPSQVAVAAERAITLPVGRDPLLQERDRGLPGLTAAQSQPRCPERPRASARYCRTSAARHPAARRFRRRRGALCVVTLLHIGHAPNDPLDRRRAEALATVRRGRGQHGGRKL